ncbi:MAG: DUF4157 domain-containing protein [Nostoc sp.]|uniref:eCIS core domain-containing protein n=1 Tax=Nostoc sp. TaxID=1180 RepID=UPI002FF596CC
MTFQKIQKTSSTNTQTPQTTSQLTSRPFPLTTKQTTPTPTPTVQAKTAAPIYHQHQEETQGLKIQRKTKTNLLEIPDLMTAPKVKLPQVIQAKLTIGEPGDKYEQEADTVARQVVQRLHAPMPRQALDISQPKSEMKQRMMQAKLVQQRRMTASTHLEAPIQKARSGGQPLAENIRQPMEEAFGADFSRVKVHTDAQSDHLNRSIQAKAFTTGQDVFFQQGAYEPGSRDGQELLAHELTHVVQQNGDGNIQRQKDVLRKKTLQLSSKPVIQPHVSSLTAKSSDIIQRRTTGEKFARGAGVFAALLLILISTGKITALRATAAGIFVVLMEMLTDWHKEQKLNLEEKMRQREIYKNASKEEKQLIQRYQNASEEQLNDRQFTNDVSNKVFKIFGIPLDETVEEVGNRRSNKRRRNRVETGVVPTVQELQKEVKPDEIKNPEDVIAEASSSKLVKIKEAGNNEVELSLTPEGLEITGRKKQKEKTRPEIGSLAENTNSTTVDTTPSIKFIWHGEVHTREQLETKIQEVMPNNTQKSAIGRCITGIENGYGKATTGHTNVKHFSVGKAGSSNGCTLFFEVNTETNVNNVVGVGQHESTAGTATTYKIFMGKERFGNTLRL